MSANECERVRKSANRVKVRSCTELHIQSHVVVMVMVSIISLTSILRYEENEHYLYSQTIHLMNATLRNNHYYYYLCL